MKKKSPITDLVKALKSDKGYLQGWVSNIAMAFKDNHYWHMSKKKGKRMNRKDLHEISNKSAIYFLNLLCGTLPPKRGLYE